MKTKGEVGAKLQQYIREHKGLEPQEREAKLEEIDVEARTATFSFSSEYEGMRYWGVEILDHKPESVRLDRINNGGAFLMDHDRWDQRGVVEKAWLADGRGYCTVRFSKSEKGEELWQDVQDRIRTQVSVRYAIHEMVLEKKEGDLEFYRVTDWEPMEISSVSIAFDPTVGVGRSQENQTYLPVNVRGVPEMDNEVEMEVEQPVEGQRSESKPVAKPAPVAAAVQRANAGEDQPVNHAAEIARTAEQYGAVELGMRAIAEGKTAEQFRKDLLDSYQERSASGDARSTVVELGMDEQSMRNYSVMNIVRGLASGNMEKHASFEMDVSRQLQEAMDVEVRGALLSYEALGYGLRQQSAGVAGKGGNLVPTDLHSDMFIEALRQTSKMGQLGAKTLSGLQGNVDIPKQTGTATFSWLAEDADATESDVDFGLVQMTPRTVAGAVAITRRLLLQTGGGIESMVRADLLQGLADALDDDVLATILGTAGIGAQAFTTAGKPTWPEIVGMETDVEEANALRGLPAYVMRPAMKGYLKGAVKASGTSDFIWENNEVNGTRAAATTQMPAGKILFGDYSQAMMGLWGALDLTIDKATKAASGGTVLRIFQDADTAVRHAGAFSLGQ